MKKIAVVGVLETTGREILSFLEEDNFPAKNLLALDHKAPLGTQVSYGEDVDLDVFNLDDFDFSGVDAAIFATPSAVSKKYVARALAAKVKVIDCSDAFVSDSDVPLIVAGLNDTLLDSAAKGLVAVPSPEATQLLMPLQAIHARYDIRRIVCSTYTSASVYGKEAMDELFSQTRKIYMNDTLVDDQKVFGKQIAFNVIPQVGEFIGDETSCEWSLNAETKKVLGGDVKVHANCAVVPAFIGSAQYVNIECAKDIDVDEVKALMQKTKGLIVFDKQVDGGYVSLTDVQGENDIYISRLRQDASVENGISFWSVADNLRAGTAKNAFNLLKLWLQK